MPAELQVPAVDVKLLPTFGVPEIVGIDELLGGTLGVAVTADDALLVSSLPEVVIVLTVNEYKVPLFNPVIVTDVFVPRLIQEPLSTLYS